MLIRMTYKIQNELTQEENTLQDTLNWPDLSSLEEASPHVMLYLDNKWGKGKYILLKVEEV